MSINVSDMQMYGRKTSEMRWGQVRQLIVPVRGVYITGKCIYDAGNHVCVLLGCIGKDRRRKSNCPSQRMEKQGSGMVESF